MRVTYKYFLQQHKVMPLDGETEVWTATMPAFAKVVRYGVSNGKPAVWAIVDTDLDQGNVDSHYLILGTGQEIPDGATHKFSMDNGPFVWHFFKLRDIKDAE